MKITTFDQSKLSYLKSIYAILCIFIFSLITGCATGRVENYSKTYVTDLKDIGAKIKPLPIKTNKENTLANLVSFDGNKSPSINLNEKIKGFFEFMEIDGKANQKFTISVNSHCACVGRKTGPGVSGYFIDESGKVIISAKRDNAGSLSFEGTYPEDKKYYLVLIADQAFVDQIVGYQHGYASGYAGLVNLGAFYGATEGTMIVKLN
jgi:hypothetical protein